MRIGEECLCAALLALSWLAGAGAAFATDGADPAQRLRHAAEMTSLDDPALKPWHLKLDVQLYDDKGQPSEKGTMEEWWTPEKQKFVYSIPSYAATEVSDGKDVYRSKGIGSVPYALAAIRRLIVHPPPSADQLDHAKPRLSIETFGNVTLDCIIVDDETLKISNPPIGLFPTFCLDHDSDQVRLVKRYGTESAALEALGTFQNRRIAVSSWIAAESKKIIEGRVISLNAQAFDPSLFAVGDKLSKVPSAQSEAASKTLPPKLLKSAAARYPTEERQSHQNGTVDVEVTVGTDGRAHQLKIIKSPAADFALSAMTAVRDYIFAPATQNDLPVESTVVVRVDFTVF